MMNNLMIALRPALCCMIVIGILSSCKMKLDYSYGSYTIVNGVASGIIIARLKHCNNKAIITVPFYVTPLQPFSSDNGIVAMGFTIQDTPSGTNQIIVPVIISAPNKKGKIMGFPDTVVLNPAH